MLLRSPALLLVDMQNEFVHPQGKLFVPGAPETVPILAEVLRAFRQAGLPVVHVRREHHPDGSDVETVRREAFRRLGGFCLPGSWGAEFIPELAPLSGEKGVVNLRDLAALGVPILTGDELMALLPQVRSLPRPS